MKNILIIFICFYLILSTLVFPQRELTPEQIFEKVNDSVVLILIYDSSNKLISQGSGVVINNSGYVLTNYHLLSVRNKIKIKHTNQLINDAEIVSIDMGKDLLVLRMSSTRLSVIKFANSKDLKIGQRIYTIGSPMGFENTISEGIISGFRKYGQDINLIQISASISPGSSGGAVVNSRGELIGISAYMVDEGQNINFAIPVNSAIGLEINSLSSDKNLVENTNLKENNDSLLITLIISFMVIGLLIVVTLFLIVRKSKYFKSNPYFNQNQIKFQLINLANGKVLNVYDYAFSIGRNVSNNLVLNNKTISKTHAEIFYSNDRRKFFIKNLSAVNPVKVNNIITSLFGLSDGDIIHITNYKFKFKNLNRPEN